MKKHLFILILVLGSLNAFSQDCVKLKIVLIDSTSLLNHYYIKGIAKDGSVKSIFSKKENDSFYCNVKVGSSYHFVLEVINRDVLTSETPSPRGAYGLSVNGVTILEADEVAYTSTCLKGLMYKKTECCYPNSHPATSRNSLLGKKKLH